MSILTELKSSLTRFKGNVWRVVEGQYNSSTMKLAGSLEDQEILEDMLEAVKPSFPEEAAGFDYLIATPYRYFPYPYGSRFRRASQREGVFYSSRDLHTAMAEIAFYRLLFFNQAEGVIYPEALCEHTAFQASIETDRALDITKPPFGDDPRYSDKSDYSATQALADAARQVEVDVIISRSVRCPQAGSNMNVLSLIAFAAKGSNQRQSWNIYTRQDRVIAVRDFPKASLEFLASDFGDPRLNSDDNLI